MEEKKEKQLLIAIGREFGSGGHEIGEKLAKKLGIAFYDRNMLDHLFQDNEEIKQKMEGYDETVSLPFVNRHVRGYTNSFAETLAELQFDFIEKKANEGESFVIVGRCGEAVLRDRPGMISVFVLGDIDEKMQRVMRKYALSEKESFNKIARHDRKRKHYHNTYSDYKWGDSRGYDICVNSSRLGVEATVELLYDFIAKSREEK